MLQASERPKPTASRVKGINLAFVSYLTRARIKVERMLLQRAETAEERRILANLEAAIRAALVDLGKLPLPADPREWRRVKKRKTS